MSRTSGPRALIDLSTLVANWRMLGKRAAPATAAAVVKADAYGLGAAQVGAALAKAGCRRFYVAWPEEGARLRTVLGPGSEIAVFHGPTDGTLELFRDHALQPVLNSSKQIKLWLDAGGSRDDVAIHLDTGMNRLGLPEQEWVGATSRIRNPSHLLSHLACADEPGHEMNVRQLAAFQRATKLWPDAKRSIAATAGVYLGPEYWMDEVRLGIGMYGGGPVPADGPAPEQVLTLTTSILQMKQIAAGETVGYGATWTSDKPRTLAIIGVGYADGFLRSASNKGYGAIRSWPHPIVGRVSMDLVALDVTGSAILPTDEVQLLGPYMPVGKQAGAMGTIDYELLTRLGSRIERTWSGGA